MSEELKIQEKFAETKDGCKVLGFIVPISDTTFEIVFQWKEFNEYGTWIARLSSNNSDLSRFASFIAMQNDRLEHLKFNPIGMFDNAIKRHFGYNNIMTHMWIGSDESAGAQSDFWLELQNQGQLQGQFYVSVYENH